MELVTANAGRTRRVMSGGREYLVAPLTLIVPGVLNGSKGALYYPPEEIARNVDAWNGMPLTLGHPSVGGQNVSARRPEVVEEFGIGTVYAAKYNGKLMAEGWFDSDLTKNKEKRVYDALVSNRPIELSTGLFTNNVPANNGANHKGRFYQHVARDYRPDHVAVLVDQQGACSLRDGCGVLINTDNDPATGKFTTPGEGPGLASDDPKKNAKKKPAVAAGSADAATAQQEHKQAVTPVKNRDTLIEALVDNCACTEGDLIPLDDRVLLNTAIQLLTVNAAAAPAPPAEEEIDPKTGKKKVPPAAPAPAPAAPVAAAPVPAPAPAAPAPVVPVPQKPIANQGAHVSKNMAEWLAEMPPEAQAVWNTAVEIEQSAKTQLITQLTANCSCGESKKNAAAIYEKMTVPQLRVLAKAVPKPVTNQHRPAPRPTDYSLAGIEVGSQDQINNAAADEANILDIPVMNFDNPLARKAG